MCAYDVKAAMLKQGNFQALTLFDTGVRHALLPPQKKNVFDHCAEMVELLLNLYDFNMSGKIQVMTSELRYSSQVTIFLTIM